MSDDRQLTKDENARAIAWERAVAECKTQGPSLTDHLFGTLDTMFDRKPDGNGNSHAINHCIARKSREKSPSK